ncbi:hypothetical protein GCM10011399_37320 [Subtercola lobariae]|uniref:Uncharacterized protein n=1 Tax=Subtercola lobariae TaxID=1588641 RepID=A0A917BFS3_9MICO|nr:hypothetical protein GCM10011399_37320 [Subtercola lobariae]
MRSRDTAGTYTEKLALDGIAPSIGAVGDAYDNVLMVTINGLYKAECIHDCLAPGLVGALVDPFSRSRDGGL